MHGQTNLRAGGDDCLRKTLRTKIEWRISWNSEVNADPTTVVISGSGAKIFERNISLNERLLLNFSQGYASAEEAHIGPQLSLSSPSHYVDSS